MERKKKRKEKLSLDQNVSEPLRLGRQLMLIGNNHCSGDGRARAHTRIAFQKPLHRLVEALF